MKKAIYSLMAVCALTLGFVSCSDDTDLDRGQHSDLPEAKAQGTYAGTLTIYDTAVSDTTITHSGAATVTLAPGSNSYSANFTMQSEAADANGDCTVNIAWSNDGFKFAIPAASGTIANGSSANVTVNGEVQPDGSMVVSYSKTVRSGRSTKTFFYKFSGKK